MEKTFNKNEKQLFFNIVKGVISEMNDGETYCSITLTLGHETKRSVNLSVRKELYDILIGLYNLGDKVLVKFYLSSKCKDGRWYTNANLLSMEMMTIPEQNY